MRIKEFHLKNYKSFYDSEKITFDKGINIIVGKNNSGKTSLIEALSTSIQSKPHRSLKVKPRSTSPVNNNSSFDVTFEISGRLAKDLCLSKEVTEFQDVPLPRNITTGEAGLLLKHLNGLFESPSMLLRYSYMASNGSNSWPNNFTPILNAYPVSSDGPNQCIYYSFQPQPDKDSYEINNKARMDGNRNEFGNKILGNLIQKIYKFDAERMKIGRSSAGTNSYLSPTASNLPEVLALLQSKRDSFRRYNELVKKIFPEISHVGVKHIDQSNVEIFVVMSGNSDEREDLTFKLSECGTGLSQILAILYVAFNQKEENVIIIDEPNSFLHPGATKALMNILSEFHHHQYIISSHSTEVFKAPTVSTLKLISLNEGASSVTSFSLDQVEETKKCLLELGIEMSDMLSSDNLVWVEGPTEKICFPIILNKFFKWPSFSISLVPVKNTGDFESAKKTTVFEIHQKMVSSHLLTPMNTFFIFDSEEKTDKEKEDMERSARGNLRFLPRRMYENYLLETSAICSLLNSYQCFENTKISESEVSDWILKNRRSYYKHTSESPLDREWLLKVDGAKLLKDLVSTLTKSTESYDKIRHGSYLTKWLIENKPSELKEIAELLKEVLKFKE